MSLQSRIVLYNSLLPLTKVHSDVRKVLLRRERSDVLGGGGKLTRPLNTIASGLHLTYEDVTFGQESFGEDSEMKGRSMIPGLKPQRPWMTVAESKYNKQPVGRCKQQNGDQYSPISKTIVSNHLLRLRYLSYTKKMKNALLLCHSSQTK